MKHGILLTVFAVLLVSCGDDAMEILNPGPCDSGISLESSDASEGAKALDICREFSAMEDDWGLISAEYIRANGDPAPVSAQYGIQASFGSNVGPMRGERMLALSNGSARTPSQIGYCGMSCNGYGTGTAPPNLPQDIGTCPGDNDIFDDVGLKLTFKAPSSATGFSIDYIYYTLDNAFPCSPFNDQFIVLMDPPPLGASVHGNIALDAFANPVSVNFGIKVDDAGLRNGNGFEDGETTGWLRTTAPVSGGSQFTLSLIIWDSGDIATNSTVLIDNFQWLNTSTEAETIKL